MSDNLKRADYLEHLKIDEHHLIYVRTGDQVVRQQTARQMDKWNQDGKIAINSEDFRHPECGKIINQGIAHTRTQNDHLVSDAPPALENVPPINHENRQVETENTKVRFTRKDRTEQNVVNLSEHGKLKKQEDDRRITDQVIQEIEHEMLKKEEDLLDKKHYLKKLNKELIEKDQHLNNLKEEQEKIELALREADNRNGLLEDLIQANKFELLRKQAQQNQTLMQLREAEKGDGDDASSEQWGGERHGADNIGTETPSTSGPTMEGIKNTQIIIKGNMNGTINYTAQSSMMQFISLAIIVALFGYILLVD